MRRRGEGVRGAGWPGTQLVQKLYFARDVFLEICFCVIPPFPLSEGAYEYFDCVMNAVSNFYVPLHLVTLTLAVVIVIGNSMI